MSLQTITRLNPDDRAKAFSRKFPSYAPLVVHNGRFYTTWVLGALYAKKSSYYGAFPHSLKERIYALFPDCQQIVHLFSGTVNDIGVMTYDIRPDMNPTICDDIRNVENHKEELGGADLFIADPPYDKSDFEKYGQKPFSKPDIISKLGRIAKPSSYLVWLDTRVPMYNKKIWGLLGYIGIVVSTNTRMRCLTLLERTSLVAEEA